MKINVAPGKYVLAVSGGLDSMVLLDILARQAATRQITNQPAQATERPQAKQPLELVVAHLDHGIRPESSQDRLFVQQQAAVRGLPFVSNAIRLGSKASEQQAREARYAFLEQTRQEVKAQAIITAHHQDDVLETMLINLHRGTGRRGLTSLSSHDTVTRPLLRYTKNELRQYAQEQQLQWREDQTNTDTRYLRNYLRLQIVPHMSAAARRQFLGIHDQLQKVNPEIDREIEGLLKTMTTRDHDRTAVVRKIFIMLPQAVAEESLAAVLRHHQVHNLSRPLLNRLVVQLKTAQPHTVFDIDGTWHVRITQQIANIVRKNG